MVDLAPVLAGSKYSLRVPRAPVMFRSVSYQFPAELETTTLKKETIPTSRSFNLFSVLPFSRSNIHDGGAGETKGNSTILSFH